MKKKLDKDFATLLKELRYPEEGEFVLKENLPTGPSREKNCDKLPIARPEVTTIVFVPMPPKTHFNMTLKKKKTIRKQIVFVWTKPAG